MKLVYHVDIVNVRGWERQGHIGTWVLDSRGPKLVVNTFKRSTAERVQPAPIYLRYMRIPFQINYRASAERVQPGPIYWQYISTFIVQKQKKKRCSDSQMILGEELHCHALPR